MKEKRKIPVKNYYILTILLIASIGLVFYLASWYQNSQENKPGYTVISEVMSEVKSEEISNYLLDNPNTVIYFTTTKNNKDRKFEKELKKYLIDKEIRNEFVYINDSDITDENFYKNFVSKYFDKDLKKKSISLDYIPNMVVVKEGKVKDVLIKYDTKINIEEVKRFLNINEVVISD